LEWGRKAVGGAAKRTLMNGMIKETMFVCHDATASDFWAGNMRWDPSVHRGTDIVIVLFAALLLIQKWPVPVIIQESKILFQSRRGARGMHSLCLCSMSVLKMRPSFLTRPFCRSTLVLVNQRKQTHESFGLIVATSLFFQLQMIQLVNSGAEKALENQILVISMVTFSHAKFINNSVVVSLLLSLMIIRFELFNHAQYDH
jgi:hypothetical protein